MRRESERGKRCSSPGERIDSIRTTIEREEEEPTTRIHPSYLGSPSLHVRQQPIRFGRNFLWNRSGFITALPAVLPTILWEPITDHLANGFLTAVSTPFFFGPCLFYLALLCSPRSNPFVACVRWFPPC